MELKGRPALYDQYQYPGIDLGSMSRIWILGQNFSSGHMFCKALRLIVMQPNGPI